MERAEVMEYLCMAGKRHFHPASYKGRTFFWKRPRCRAYGYCCVNANPSKKKTGTENRRERANSALRRVGRRTCRTVHRLLSQQTRSHNPNKNGEETKRASKRLLNAFRETNYAIRGFLWPPRNVRRRDVAYRRDSCYCRFASTQLCAYRSS